jgi:hypothetical protein
MVRRSGIFTTVIQPPLILFVSVPAAYWFFRGAGLSATKDTLISCGYPLIERFPLMGFTSAGVLLIGIARWSFGMLRRSPAARPEHEVTTPAAPGRMAMLGKSITATMSGLFAREPEEDADLADEMTDEPEPKRSFDRPARPARSARPAGAAATTGPIPAAATTKQGRNGRPVQRAEPDRPRRVRRPTGEAPQPTAERPRRVRPRGDAPPEPDQQLRRRRPAAERETRVPLPPRDPNRPNPYQRPGYERADRRIRYGDHEPPPAAPRPSSNGNGSTASSGSHHPVSRVRYRGPQEGESRTENRVRRRTARPSEPETWEYDI